MTSKLEMSFLDTDLPGISIDDIPNKYTNTNFGIKTSKSNKNIDTDVDESDIIAITEIKYSDILNSSKRILAIDPSQHSSGFAIYDKETGFTLAQSKLDFNNKSTDAMRFYNLQKQMFTDLIDFINMVYPDSKTNPVVFDSIIIEDTLFERNAQTFKVLVLLNSVIDYIIAQGYVKTNNFMRISNQTWKSELRQFKIGKKYKNDKLDIEESLLMLGVPLAVEQYMLSDREKKVTGYQDKLDAIGLLLSTVLIKNPDAKKARKKVQKLQFDITSEPDEYLEQGFQLMKVKRPDLYIKDVINDLKYRQQAVQIIIPFKSLGSWGIQHDLFADSSYENYLVITGRR